MKNAVLSVWPEVCSLKLKQYFKTAFLALVFVMALGFVETAKAQPVVLDFDNNTGLSSSQIYIQFLGGNPVTGTYVDPITGLTTNLVQNTSYSLAQLGDLSQLQITALNSGRIYVSYGAYGMSNLGADNGGYTPSAGVPTDPNYKTRYQYFELTAQQKPNGSVNYYGDLTYIDFTAISMSMKAVGTTGGTAVSNPIQLSAPTQTLVNLANAASTVGNPGGTSPVLPAGSSTTLPNSTFARVISPQFGATTNYHDFTSYLNTLSGTSVEIAGTFVGTGTQPTGTPATQAQTYDFTGRFSGNALTGSITLTAQGDSGISNTALFGFAATPTNQGVGNGTLTPGSPVTITILNSNLNSQDGIYGNNVVYTVTADGTTYTTTGITNDVFGRAVGDLLAGLSLGDVGSTTMVTDPLSPTGSVTLGSLPSSAWWAGGEAGGGATFIPSLSGTGALVSTPIDWSDTPSSKGIYLGAAQSNPLFYNGYAANLTGTNVLNQPTAGYGFPLQDRLGTNLLTYNTLNSPNTILDLILNPDASSGIPIQTGIFTGTSTGTTPVTYSWSSHNWATNNTGTTGAFSLNQGPPASGASVQFQGLTPSGSFNPSGVYTINTGTDRTVGGIDFNYGAGTFTINGNTLFLSGDIVNSSTNNQTINSNLEFDASGNVIAAYGDLTLNGSLALTGTTIAAFSGMHNSYVNGVVSGTGSVIMYGTESGTMSPTLYLNNANTFSGGVTLMSGTLVLGNDSAMGTGTFTVTNTVNEVASASSIAPVNYTNTLQSGSGARTIANAVALGGDLTISGTGGFDFTGPVTLNGQLVTTGTVTALTAVPVSVTNSVPVTFSGAIGEGMTGMGFTKSGSGTMTFSGTSANTFTGMLSVNEGTLILDKTGVTALGGNLTIGTGQGAGARVQLGASGQFSPTAIVTVNSDGHLDLQSFDTSINQLNMSGGTVDGSGTLNLNSYTTGTGTNTVSYGGVFFNGTGASSAVIHTDISLTGTGIQTFNIANTTAGTQVVLLGTLSGTDVSFSKTGSGVLDLAGGYALTGTTSISIGQGLLKVNDLAGAAVTIGAGGALGSLSTGGTFTTINVKSLESAGGAILLSLGASNASDKIAAAASGPVTLQPASDITTFLFSSNGITAGTGSFTLITAGTGQFGTLNTAALQFASIDIDGLTGNFSLNSSGGTDSLVFNYQSGVTNTYGALSGSWSTPTNWTGSTSGVPLNGADLVFLGSGTITSTITVSDSTNRTTGSITFSGNPFLINETGTLTVGGNITNGTTYLQTFAGGDIAFNANRTIDSGSGGLEFSGATMNISSAGGPPNTLTFTGSGTTTIDSVIVDGLSPGGSIWKTGTGLLVLNGVNTFTGGVTIAGGTVAISSSSGLGYDNSPSNTLTFAGGSLQTSGTGTFNPDRNVVMESTGIIDTLSGASLQIEGQITGDGGLTKDGAGELILANTGTVTNTYAGPTTVNGGVLETTFDGALGTAGITVNSGGSLVIDGASSVTQSITLSGTGAAGHGTLELAGANSTYSGDITLAAAASIEADASTTFNIDGNVATGANSLTLVGAAGSILNLTGESGASGSLSGSGDLIVTGAGSTVNIDGANPGFTGSVNVEQGTLNIQQSNSIGLTPPSVTVAAGGSLAFTNSALQQPITYDFGSITLSGTGAGIDSGAINNAGGGVTTVTGDISLGADTEIDSSTGSLTLTGSISDGTHKLTLNNQGSQMVLSGEISGSDGIDVKGTSTVLLSGTNTYTGGTTVEAGNGIVVANDSGLGTVSGTNTVTVATAASLELEGGITVGQAIAISGSGVSSNGALDSLSGTNTVTGDVNVNTTNGATIEAYSGQLNIQGDLTSSTAGTTISIQGYGTVAITGAPSLTNITEFDINSGTFVANDLTGKTLVIGQATAGPITSGSAPTFSPGGLNAITTVDVDNLTVQYNAVLAMDLSGTSTSDKISASTAPNISIVPSFSFYFNNDTTGSSGPVSTTGGTYTLIYSSSGNGIAGSVAGLSFTSNIPGLAGKFVIENGAGVDLDFVGSASGTAAVWSGAGTVTGSWTDASKWIDVGFTGVPAAGSAVAFTNTVTGTVETINDQLAGGIAFQSGSAALTLTGSMIGIYGTIENDSSVNQTIATKLVMVQDTTVNAANGDVTLSGTVDFGSYSATPTLTISGTSTTTVSGAVEASTDGVSGTVDVGGHLVVASAGSVTGAVNVSSGGSVGGSGTINGQVTVGSGGKTYPGDPSVLTISNVEYQAGSTAEFAITTTGSATPTAGSDYDQIKLSGFGTGLQIDSGTTTIQLDLGTMTLATLQANAGNSAKDSYLLFLLENGITVGQFSTLTLLDGSTPYTAAIVDGVANFDPADYPSIDLQFDFSDSVPGSGGSGYGFTVLTGAVPEPSDWAPYLALSFVLAAFLRRRGKAGKIG
jgi:autotransporter-associated beta strand protein